ncbi:MAG: hypothetical protein KDC90_05520 [Ignavibacteriae bacterium]|nr:hypothetical protein [Ignavibacteriota bacterium]
MYKALKYGALLLYSCYELRSDHSRKRCEICSVRVSIDWARFQDTRAGVAARTNASYDVWQKK